MGKVLSKIKTSYHPLLFIPPNPPHYITLPGLEFVKSGTNQIACVFYDLKSSVTIFYSHGNACDIGDVYNLMIDIAYKLKVNLLLWDYPGYGRSNGNSSEETVCKSAVDVWTYFNSKRKTKWIIYGTSLGSGPSCHLASYLSNNGLNYSGLMLECPLSSAISVFVPEPLSHSSFCIDSFKNYWHICAVDKPVFLIHGTEDDVIPFSASRSLSKKLPKNYLYKLWGVEGASHNDIKTTAGTEIFIQKMGKFIDHCLA